MGDGEAAAIARVATEAAMEALLTGMATESRALGGTAALPAGLWLLSQQGVATLIHDHLSTLRQRWADHAATAHVREAAARDAAARAAAASAELALVEAQRRAEAAGLRVVELQTAHAAAQADHDRAAAAWGEEKTRLVREAEAGFSQLTANITDKAQDVIRQLRSEVRQAAGAVG